jgi:GT2 family glycosyltransferase
VYFLTLDFNARDGTTFKGKRGFVPNAQPVNLSPSPAFYLQGAKRLSTETGSHEGESPSMTAFVERLRPSRVHPTRRPSVKGKFLFLGDEKLQLKGVTYGPFNSDDDAAEFDAELVERDFSEMAAHGLNAVRLYTVPPRWMLDAAARHGLRLMIGIPWEQHIAFLDNRGRRASIERRIAEAVRSCAGHPAVLCFAIGNEIPASIVRWHGRRRIERFLHRLYRAAKAEDPDALVTYINYPSTEYLRLPFVDLVCFNVYLESPDRLDAYLARLQNLADERPLIMAEIGLDSRRNGQEKQAETIDWQLRLAGASGCAGAFVFSWTDEWHRGGHDIGDWDFGLTTRDRTPKRALAAVSAAFAEGPFPPGLRWPRVSVVVCTYNGAATLADCLDGLQNLDYPDYEVIVVSDGSTDAVGQIVSEYEVQLIETENRGLSSARNTGLRAATGEIVAYTDDDTRPDVDWLRYLAHTFATTDYAAVGGPNPLPPYARGVEQCVSNAPGGPTHVLLTDRDAEHIPGCNMAFRRSALEAVGGFDEQFRIAGDDVDVCWRLLENGLKLGFNPGAVVWHRRRRTVRSYYRQQRGYGRAEALLERKWPEKYSPAGHVGWGGRLYGNGSAQHRGGWRWRIYYGGWGTGLFQSIYGPRRGLLESLPLMPEWYLVILVLAALSASGALWAPLLLALPLLGLAVGALLVDAGLGGARAVFQSTRRTELRLRILTAMLYFLQPIARLQGRLRDGLTPWRRRGPPGFRLPVPRMAALWSEHWHAVEDYLRGICATLKQEGTVVISGGDWDRWDLKVRGGALGAAKLRVATEEHGEGRQLIRVSWWPSLTRAALVLGGLVASLELAAFLSQAWNATTVLAAVAVFLVLRAIYECGAAVAIIARLLHRPSDSSAEVLRELAPLSDD